MSYAAKPTARPGARYYHRRAKEPLTSLVIALRLTAAERARLNAEAKARNLLPTGLGRIALERIIQAGLFKAVLGD